jgi:hypothetical protein
MSTSIHSVASSILLIFLAPVFCLVAFTSVSSDHEIFAHVNLALSLFENYRSLAEFGSLLATKSEYMGATVKRVWPKRDVSTEQQPMK